MIDSAVCFFEEAVTKVRGEVEDDFGFLLGGKILVVPVRGEEAVFWHGNGG